MSRMKFGLKSALILLVAGLLCLGTAQVMAQTPETPVTDPQPPDAVDGDEAGAPNTANPPAYIGELMKVTELKQAQVDQMRTDGLGWGEVRIATLLAEKIAANSGGTLAFDAALAQVLAARAEGKGFGQIAAENNLKVGELVKNGGKKGGDAEKGSAGSTGGASVKGKKPGFFARIGRFLGFGKSADKSSKPASVETSQASVKDAKGSKLERPARFDRSAKLEKPERPARPEKPEKGPHK